jgi:hypothetical protein
MRLCETPTSIPIALKGALVTELTMEQRLEYACADWFDSVKGHPGRGFWSTISEEDRQDYRNEIMVALRGAFPELFSEPPTARLVRFRVEERPPFDLSDP